MSLRPAFQSLHDWLVDGAPGADTPPKLLARVCDELHRGGVPLERVTGFVRTLHPRIAGKRYQWKPGGEEVVVADLPWGDLQSAGFRSGPLPRVFEQGAEYRTALAGTAPLEFAQLEDLRVQGLTDYLALPLRFIGGAANAITYSTRAAGGFSDDQLDALRWITRPLARVAETLSLMRTAMNLLNTYVGHNAGERILLGHIQPGDTETIRCVIWFSDLRGFTSMSGQSSPAETIAVLNELFECQVPFIEKHGGEVLKFIGDGLLAIFPLEGAEGGDSAEAAAAASSEAFAALDVLNARRATAGAAPLRFGLALHSGDVAYGNIGGANRLDFTAIGSAVNLASRIEGLTGKLGKDVLLSEEVARALKRPTRVVGSFELKGFSVPHTVYELV